jgi:hypothetical protein
MAGALMGFLKQPGRNLRRRCYLATVRQRYAIISTKVSEEYDDNSDG